MSAPSGPQALEIAGLTVDVPGRRVVDGLSLTVPAGSVVALVGASGSGKSLTARSVLRLHHPEAGVSASGRILVGEVDVLSLDTRSLRALRGSQAGYAFQDAAASLNPTITVGRHFTETVRAHAGGDPYELGVAALERCGLPGETLWEARPYELSGGQAQRVALALATVLSPGLLIADEVTTALDPITQASVLDMIRAQAVDGGRGVLLITHDLAVAGRWADSIAVLADGVIVEHGPTAEILTSPGTGLTRRLLAAAAPVRPAPSAALPDEPRPDERGAVLRAAGVRRVLRGRGRTTVALDGVEVTVRTGESVAIVGRSGSGKSTLAGALALLDRPDTGQVLADGRDVWSLRDRERRALRRGIGLVFQDALASFDPRYSVRQVVAEAVPDDGATVEALLDRVGLDGSYAGRRPVTLSGGERQRVALARALAARPRVLIADEPTTGLDVLAQDHILSLLTRLRHEEDLTVIFVTHDLHVAQRIADRVLVLAGGHLTDDLPARSLHISANPETQALLAAVPSPSSSRPTG